MKTEFKTVDEIVNILFDRLKDDDGSDQFVKDGSVAYHHLFGMSVRNEFLLWDTENPYTMKDYEPEMKNGADCNPKHPDNLSGEILERLHKKMKQYKENKK